MITRITIHNFQCHKHLDLDLGRSTVLSGNSNSGKTAVLRALYWVLFNTPSGDAYVSYWAKNKMKFKADEYTSVIVEVDGHVIERKRSNDFNGYIVDGKVYEALRTAVPDEVTKIFNLADASVQRQMDAPFLLAATPGEASQYLNSLAGLECVDEILTIAKRNVADTSATLEETKDSVDALEKEVGSYGWVSSAEDLLKKASDEEPAIARLTHRIEALSKLITDYKAIRNYPEIPEWLINGDRSVIIYNKESAIRALDSYINTCKILARVEPALRKVGALQIPVPPKHTEDDVYSLSRSIHNYGVASSVNKLCTKYLTALSGLEEPKPCRWEGKFDPLVRSINNYRDILDSESSVDTALRKLARLKEPKPCKWTSRDMSALVRSVREYNSVVNTIADCKDYLDDAYSSLDGVACPVCGRPLSKDTCRL